MNQYLKVLHPKPHTGICSRPRSPRTLNGRLGGGGDKVPGGFPKRGRVGFLEALRHGQDDDLI